jgi:HSP20 family protein
MTKIDVKKSEDVKRTFKEKMSELLEDMWDKIGQHHHGLYATPGKIGKPDADLSESNEVLTYQLELPGMDDDDIEVEISPGMLSIRGEKRDEQEEKGGNYIFRERSYGSFERRFIIPESANVKKVKATFDKGVLVVTVPYEFDKQGETKKIDVNVT